MARVALPPPRAAAAVLLVGALTACTLLGSTYPDLPFENPGLRALPADAMPATTSADDAVGIAHRATGITTRPVGVGRRERQADNRIVWVVVFAVTGEGRPCGPAPPLPAEEPATCVTGHAGAVIDDETGHLHHTFETGGQIWSEE
jgi:hypothetical protein